MDPDRRAGVGVTDQPQDPPVDPDLTIEDILNGPDTPIPDDYDDGRDPNIPLDYDPDQQPGANP